MTNHEDIAFLPATKLSSLYRERKLSPVEAIEAALRQIERLNATLNAYCLVDAEAALEQARASEARFMSREGLGTLDGVPVAVKDIFLTRGWPTLRGSLLVDPNQPWDQDAPTVRALREDGAVLLGKTTTPELGWKGVTDSPLYGITRNPWDPEVTPGGSSGGSAVAVATGMGPLALGTDGGGSIRIPASFTGTSGIKPTYGRVPHWPVSPYGTLAHAGPMARTIEDVALMLGVIARTDPRDWLALPPEAGVDYLAELGTKPSKLRVAYSPTLGFAKVDPEVRAAVDAAAKVFEQELGAEVEAVDPGIEDPLDTFHVLWNSGAAQVVRHYTPEQRAKLDPGLLEIVEDGERYSAVEYVDANTRRGQFAVHINQFFQDYDLLLTPAMPIPPFTAGLEVPEDWPHRRWATWSAFTYPFNITQQPAASVPCGFTASGLPIGLQIVGRKYEDALVLRAAHAYQKACPEHLQIPPMALTGK
jgi:aspartyl-tRNA(Asn)/glutamyl-tRNA(Gln) amidotransferase subunit A